MFIVDLHIFTVKSFFKFLLIWNTQILSNDNKLPNNLVTNESSHNRFEREPYFLVDHWSRVLHDIYVSDWGRFHHVYISCGVNQTSTVVGITFLRGVRLCSLKLPCALLVFKHVMRSYVIVWRSFINNYWFLGWYNIKKVPGNIFAELLNLARMATIRALTHGDVSNRST